MRKDWEVYSIKDLGKVITGSTPSTKDDLNYSSNDYSFVKPSDIPQNQILYIDNTECYVSEYAFKNSKILPSGTVLVTCIGIIGKVGITKNDCICNQQINAIIPNDKVNNKFLAYSIFAKREVLSLIANSPVVPIINKNDFSNIKLQLPTLQTQQQIVEELDSLTSIIEKHKKQLEELDTLAQSIFYDMFGDPITNKKGWKTKKLGETSTLHNGRAFKPTDWSNSGLPIVRIQNLNNPTLPFNYYDGEVANNHRLYGGELLYAWSGTPDTSFGAHIWYGGDAVLNQHIFKIEYNKDLLNIKYFVFNLNGIVNSMFDKTHGGVGLQHITKGTLTSQNICLPPLYLQQQFASKIESIEKQKELIKQSLSEVQQLFDSRMDYYFG